METKNLVGIVRRAQSGDQSARQELYLDSSKSVYFLALKILKNPDDAKDIMQDVFITVFDKLPGLKRPAAYYKWLNQITANKCISFMRKKKFVLSEKQDGLEALDSKGEGGIKTPEMLCDEKETRQLIMDIIDALPDAQRICVMYRYFSQLTIKEIAAMTETNEHTIKSRLALARKKIREAILEKEEKEGIRLHALVPIMPVLIKSFEDFQMPESMTARGWEQITKRAENIAVPSQKTATLNQLGSKAGKDVAGMAARRTVPLAVKAAAAVVAGVLVTVGIVAANLSMQPSESDMPPISSTAEISAQPSEEPSEPSEKPSKPSEKSSEPSKQESSTPGAEDYAQYYASVLEGYRAFSLSEPEDYIEAAGMLGGDNIEILIYAEDPRTDFGYALQDLNGNGIPELVLLSKSIPNICAIYSLVDNSPHLIDSFWTRYSCEIGVDGILYIHGSGGAFDSVDGTYTIAQDGTSLVRIEEIGIESYDSDQDFDMPYGYYRIDADGVKTVITEDEAADARQKRDEAKANQWDFDFIPLW